MADLKDLKMYEIAEKYRSRELSPVEYTKYVIREIKNRWDLNTVVTLDEELALLQAKESEKRYGDQTPRSSIDGIPIGIKDIIDTKDLITTYGCKAYQQNYPKEDAFVVQKLKEAGAGVFIKCNTSQFALGPTGEVSFGGPVKNGRNPEYTTGGSSSGSASAVAAHLLPGTLGSDSGGSIRVPSSICGVVGIKPTFSLVSNQGVMPVSETVDCVGPITRCVEDGTMILQAIAGYNIADWRSSKTPYVDFASRIKEGVKGAKAVVIRNLFDGAIMPEVVKGCQDAIEVLRSLFFLQILAKTQLPLNIDCIIPDNDSVRLLSQFVEEMDISDLFRTYFAQREFDLRIYLDELSIGRNYSKDKSLHRGSPWHQESSCS